MKRSMARGIGLVAKREFVTTVTSKGFLIGLLIMPALLLIVIAVVPRIAGSRGPQVVGDVAIIDHTSRVAAELSTTLEPAAMAARAAASSRNRPGGPAAVPRLTLIERPASADLQQQKAWLLDEQKSSKHLALVVIQPDAVERAAGSEDFGGYELYVTSSVNDATESAIHESVRQALVATRLKATGVELSQVEASMRVTRPNAIIVAPAGEQTSRRGFSRALPFICGLLLFMGVISGGQTLMASTIEEKSSRVVEVLLAAVSPLELMWGKLLAQLGIGMIVMSLYVGLGIAGLSQFQMLGLLDPALIVALFVFYLITYLMFGALMLAVGAAVSQIADASSLMGPITLLLVLPYVLSPFIGQAPNSAFSVAMSFIPPVNTFAMLARLASDSPPPAWQVVLTMGVGVAAACVSVWFASKVFRIGLLLHGKPPNLATLVRWARMS